MEWRISRYPIKISQLHQLDINPICKFVGHDQLHHGRDHFFLFFLIFPLVVHLLTQPPEFPQTLPVQVKTIGRWPGRWSQPPHFGGEFEFRVLAASAIVGGFNPAEKNATIVVI